MPKGQVTRYRSSKSVHDKGLYKKATLHIDGREVLSYIEFDTGSTGLASVTGDDSPLRSKLWHSHKGIPKELVMEFFLMCFEAPMAGPNETLYGEMYEW